MLTFNQYIIPYSPLNPPPLAEDSIIPLMDLIKRVGLEEAFDQQDQKLIEMLQARAKDSGDLSSPRDLHRVLLELLLNNSHPPELYITKFLNYLTPEERIELLNHQEPTNGQTIVMKVLAHSKVQASLIHTLLIMGSNINALNSKGNNALHIAIQRDRSPEICEALLQPLTHKEKIALLTAQNSIGLTPLHYIWNHSSTDMLELLIKHGADINIPSAQGKTLLHQIILNQHQARRFQAIHMQAALDTLLAKLIQRGALHRQDTKGKTPLHYAAEYSAPKESYEALLMSLDLKERREVLNVQDQEGHTILMIALLNPQPDLSLIDTLVRLGSNIGTLDNKRCNLLHLAIRMNHLPEIFEALLQSTTHEEKIALLATQNRLGMTPLHDAHNYRDPKKLYSIFLSNLSRQESVYLVNIRDIAGETALHLAKKRRAFSSLSLLLEQGADPQLCNHQNQPAIECVERTLLRAAKIQNRWDQYRVITNETKRVMECHYLNEEQKDSALILQANHSGNRAFTFYVDNFTHEIDNLTTFSDHFYQTHLQTVASVEEAAHLLEKTKSNLLIIQGHSPGGNSSASSSLRFGYSSKKSSSPILFAGNVTWLKAVKRHMEDNGTLIFESCALAKEEKEGAVNLCQETADYFEEAQGITVIGSDKDIIPYQSLYQLESFPIVRYFDSKSGEESTVVWQGQSRIKYSGYAEKVILDNYFR